jgi:hypothetical protein
MTGDIAGAVNGLSVPVLVGIVVILVVLIGVLGTVTWKLLRKKLEGYEQFQKLIDGYLKAQADKDAALVERYSVLTERMKARERADDLLEERLRTGSQMFEKINQRMSEQALAQVTFCKTLADQQAEFVKTQQKSMVEFAAQWQRTLVDLAGKFALEASVREYKERHEREHDKISCEMKNLAEMFEKTQRAVCGIEQKVEGGLMAITTLLSKHVTIKDGVS